MHLADLPFTPLIIEVEPVRNDVFDAKFEINDSVHLKQLVTGELLMRVRDHSEMVQVLDERNNYELQQLFDSRKDFEAWITHAAKGQKNTTIYIAIQSFNAIHLLTEPITIRVAEDVLEAANRHRRPSSTSGEPSYSEVIAWISDNCLAIGTGDTKKMVIDAGYESKSDAFRIIGHRNALDVSNKGNGLQAVKWVNKSTIPSSTLERLQLVEGFISFIDVSEVTAQKLIQKTELDTIVEQSNGSYLKVWDEYNRIERDTILKRVRDVGWIRFTKTTYRPDGSLRLEFDDESSVVSFIKLIERTEDLSFAIAHELPSHLTGKDLQEQPDDVKHRIEKQLEVKILAKNKNTITVQLESEDTYNSKEGGFLFASMMGDKVRLERRDRAWKIIRNLEAPIPGLALLLERSEKYKARPFPHHRVESSMLRKSFYGEITPTSNQLRALELAIQTPDIILIQGPPGTGKTQVISALSQLIANEETRKKFDFGKVLLTSYQHDAVDNVASRTMVMGLPTPKIGSRGGREDTFVWNELTTWKQALQDNMKTQFNLDMQPPVASVKAYVQDQLLGYYQQPGTNTETIQILRTISIKSLGYIPAEKQTALDNFIEEFSIKSGLIGLSPIDRRGIERDARALRTDPVAFMDDGPHHAQKLLLRVQAAKTPLLSESMKAILEEAASWDKEDQPPSQFLNKLQEISEYLLINISADPQLGRHNVDVQNIISDVLEELLSAAQRQPNNVEAVAQRFLDDLDNDPDGVIQAVLRYTSVLAATCQQSASNRLFGIKQSGNWSYFDTVIVDEASRSNPLDLLIPLVQAKRRIILVGDHRQLPQLIEHDIEKNLGESSLETRDLLQKSLFERLFNYMDELEKRDGIVRRITLDTQYRMHPILGQFVSDTFYRKYGEGFKSVLPADYFAHSIERYKERVAVWIDVPLGEETREHHYMGSKKRSAEAKRIAQEVKYLLDEHPDLSIGVITFYSAQVNEIDSYLEKQAVKDRDGASFVMAPEYRRAKLHVGTVDSFQGKEFDVVLLSPVRSNKEGEYGFLALENRQCVAMSRQKKLLIVVGDANMTKGDKATQLVSGLVEFYALCGQEPHGLRI